MVYVFTFGRWAARAGDPGDVSDSAAGRHAPDAG